jgi:hypothetical protein
VLNKKLDATAKFFIYYSRTNDATHIALSGTSFYGSQISIHSAVKEVQVTQRLAERGTRAWL